MSTLKKVLFSVLIVQSVFVAIDAAEKRPTKSSKKQALSRRPFRPILPTIKEDSCPGAPVVSGKENYFSPNIEGFSLPSAEEPAIVCDMARDKQFLAKSTILSTVQKANRALPVPVSSIRTPLDTFYGDKKNTMPALEIVLRSLKAKGSWYNPSMLQTCTCPDTKNLSTKFYHVLPAGTITLCGEQLDDRFFAKDKRTCFEQLQAYMRQQARKKAITEQKN